MDLNRLVAVPALSLGTFVAEGVGALRGQPPYTDVPPLELSPGLLAEALLDRGLVLAMNLMSGVPRSSTIRRVRQELEVARRMYAERGWLRNPRAYHVAPPPLDEYEMRTESARQLGRMIDFEHLEFDSGYEPHADEPGRERWLDYAPNRVAHAYVLQDDPAAPWLVCLHGFAMGSPPLDFAGFDAHHLHGDLGLNLVMPVLPLHGPRGGSAVSGGELLSAEYLDVVHSIAQTAWEVRRIVGWLRARGAQRVGLYGISMGGYNAALVASLERDLDCVIAGVPPVDFPSVAHDSIPELIRAYEEEIALDWESVRAVTHVVSPLALAPFVPHDRRFIFAGLADRVVRPDQPRALWRHWDRPEIHWFAGSHLGYRWTRSVAHFVDTALAPMTQLGDGP